MYLISSFYWWFFRACEKKSKNTVVNRFVGSCARRLIMKSHSSMSLPNSGIIKNIGIFLENIQKFSKCYNFFVLKYFLDRKKVLKSRDANSCISGENVGPLAHYESKNCIPCWSNCPQKWTNWHPGLSKLFSDQTNI